MRRRANREQRVANRGCAEAEIEINSYRDLKVWQEAMFLAEAMYRLSTRFPKEELYGITSQVRRAAASVAANIAEGHGRENTGSFIQFLRVSQGSLKELETHVLLASRVGIAADNEVEPLLAKCDELGECCDR